MSTFHGKDGVVKVGANAVAEIKNWSVEETADLAEDTAMGDTARTFKPGLTSWSAQIECQWDDTDTTGQEALLINTSVTLNLQPEGDTAGDYLMTGSAIVTNRGNAIAFDGIVTQTFQLQGTGALSRTTVGA